jgi:uncharacterized membrane protein YsdA (DUF1294 family)
MLLDSVLMNALFVVIIIWFIIFVVCLVSLSRRKDITIPEKIFWAIAIFFAPVVGLIFYVVFGFNKRRRTNNMNN